MNLEDYANASNWPTSLEEAKQFAHDAISHFKWKNKIPVFAQQIETATTIKRLQEIVIYPILSGEGMKSIK